jgi:hypothetical protein
VTIPDHVPTDSQRSRFECWACGWDEDEDLIERFTSHACDDCRDQACGGRTHTVCHGCFHAVMALKSDSFQHQARLAYLVSHTQWDENG